MLVIINIPHLRPDRPEFDERFAKVYCPRRDWHQPKKDNKMDIFVGNLPYDVDESAIEGAFAAHGTVSNVKLLTDRDSGRSRGIAFVTMNDLKEAQAAITAMDGEEIGGREVKVNQARERAPNSGGGNFRRNSGGGRDRY